MNRRAFLLTPLIAVIPLPRDPYEGWAPNGNWRRMGKPIAGSLNHGYTQAMYDQNYADWMAQR
jgi:hypothetical protein